MLYIHASHGWFQEGEWDGTRRDKTWQLIYLTRGVIETKKISRWLAEVFKNRCFTRPLHPPSAGHPLNKSIKSILPKMTSLVSPRPLWCLDRRSPRVGRPSCSSLREIERLPAGGDVRPEIRRSVPQFPAIREAKRVVLVRHGQSTWNEEGRIQGSSNASILTPKGESQAETSRQMLLGDSFDVCFTRFLPFSPRT